MKIAEWKRALKHAMSTIDDALCAVDILADQAGDGVGHEVSLTDLAIAGLRLASARNMLRKADMEPCIPAEVKS